VLFTINLKVVRPSERITAAHCLEMLSTDKLEGNLTTIFSYLRNTESFWSIHRNDLNCMSFIMDHQPGLSL